MSARRSRLLGWSLSAVAVLLAGLAAIPFAARVHGEELVADLSDHLIAVTTGFTGAEVLLFGAVGASAPDAERPEIAVIVRGPAQSIVVRRKSQIAGLWINDREMTFPSVPSFYSLAASGALWEIVKRSERDRHQIGIESLRLDAQDADPSSVPYNLFKQALIRRMQFEGLFPPRIEPISFLGKQLFRVKVKFPANVPTGSYSVQVFLLRNGQVVRAQTTPLIVSKAGFSADLFQFANENGTAYGIFAVFGAILCGFAAAAAFRRA